MANDLPHLFFPSSIFCRNLDCPFRNEKPGASAFHHPPPSCDRKNLQLSTLEREDVELTLPLLNEAGPVSAGRNLVSAVLELFFCGPSAFADQGVGPFFRHVPNRPPFPRWKNAPPAQKGPCGLVSDLARDTPLELEVEIGFFPSVTVAGGKSCGGFPLFTSPATSSAMTAACGPPRFPARSACGHATLFARGATIRSAPSPCSRFPVSLPPPTLPPGC